MSLTLIEAAVLHVDRIDPEEEKNTKGQEWKKEDKRRQDEDKEHEMVQKQGNRENQGPDEAASLTENRDSEIIGEQQHELDQHLSSAQEDEGPFEADG